MHLMLFQRSLRLFLFILFYTFCSVAVMSTILSSGSFIHSSASVNLLLIPSSVLFISLFFFWSLVLLGLGKHFFHLLHCLPKILDHLHYHYSELFFWKFAYLHFIGLFFWGFILSLHLGHNFLLFHLD